MKHIPNHIRSSIRLFAFYVANGSLGSSANEFPDYDALLIDECFLPALFAVFFSDIDLDNSKSFAQAERSAWDFVKSLIETDAKLDLVRYETEALQYEDYRQDICRLARHLSVSTIPRSLKNGVDYWTCGSGLELIFAVYCNVAELDQGLRVSNHEYACGRIDLMVDADGIVLKDWETELH